jgi:SlyX protein
LHERIQRLEEKIAYLERHVTEQDRAMLELAEELAALRGEVRLWRERASAAGAGGGADSVSAEQERPPHY